MNDAPTPTADNSEPSGLELVETRYSAIPGQPSIIWRDSVTTTVVSLCPVPQVGLVAVMPETLNFVMIVYRTGNSLTKQEALALMDQGANQLDIGALVPDDLETVEYQIALDPEGTSNEHGTGFRGILCVPASAELLEQNLSLAIMQGQAAARIIDAMRPASTSQTSALH